MFRVSGTAFNSTLPSFFFTTVWVTGLPRWRSHNESTCQCRRHKSSRFNPWVRKIPWRRKWQSTLEFLPEKPHGQRSMVGYSPRVAKSRTQLSMSTLSEYIFLIVMSSCWIDSFIIMSCTLFLAILFKFYFV